MDEEMGRLDEAAERAYRAEADAALARFEPKGLNAMLREDYTTALRAQINPTGEADR